MLKSITMDYKSKYKYTKGEMEINRAFKMQDMELKDLDERTRSLSQSNDKLHSDILNREKDLTDLDQKVQQLKKKALEIAEANNIIIPDSLKKDISTSIEEIPVDDSPLMADEKIAKTDIPSWEEVMAKTDQMVPEEVVLEDLLSQQEFQYCIEDVQRINDEFEHKVKLNKTDMKFLIIATALQTARWIIIQQLIGDLGETIDPNERISSEEGDKIKKKTIHDWNKKHEEKNLIHSEKDYPTWKDILFGQYRLIDGLGKSSWKCPYDAQANGPLGFDDGGKGKHRVNTLGHDPILVWISGTANIMTCTISLTK